MREILFRAKAINRIEGKEYRTNYKNGDWVYGLLSKPHYKFGDYDFAAEMTNTDLVSGIDVDYTTLGQFTGLTDCNGNKIFEGDIVCYKESICTPRKGIICFGSYEGNLGDTLCHRGFFVKWLNDPFIRKEICFWVYEREIEIIGNIHDTPELFGSDDNAVN